MKKVEGESGDAAHSPNKGRNGGDKSKFLLAYCFNVKVKEADFDDSQAQIPSAIIEDIIADVELMKGQSSAFGDRF